MAWCRINVSKCQPKTEAHFSFLFIIGTVQIMDKREADWLFLDLINGFAISRQAIQPAVVAKRISMPATMR